MDLEKTIKNLRARGTEVQHFATGAEAAEYLLSQIHGKTVGISGSMTIEQIDLYDRLCADNQVAWHWKEGGVQFGQVDGEDNVYARAAKAEVYLCSANAISEDGEIVNIDGVGNRISAMTYGPGKTIYVVASTNKICPDLESAIWRVRNVAAPKRAGSMPGKRPCTVTKSCADCRSPERMCRAMMIMFGKMVGMEKLEVVLVDEPLGY